MLTFHDRESLHALADLFRETGRAIDTAADFPREQADALRTIKENLAKLCVRRMGGLQPGPWEAVEVLEPEPSPRDVVSVTKRQPMGAA